MKEKICEERDCCLIFVVVVVVVYRGMWIFNTKHSQFLKTVSLHPFQKILHPSLLIPHDLHENRRTCRHAVNFDPLHSSTPQKQDILTITSHACSTCLTIVENSLPKPVNDSLELEPEASYPQLRHHSILCNNMPLSSLSGIVIKIQCCQKPQITSVRYKYKSLFPSFWF